jgi:hypothetical protein
VAAFYALLSTRFEPWLAAAGLIPLVAFWWTDGYFLWQERLFRALYDEVRRASPTVELMSMDVRIYMIERRWAAATLSRTFTICYAPLTMLNLFLIVIAIGTE